MSGGQDHAGLPYLRYLHEIRPAGGPAATVAPGALSGIEPTPVGQAANRHAMGPPAALADAGSPLEAHAAADQRPIGGIKPPHFRSDRHYCHPRLPRCEPPAGDTCPASSSRWAIAIRPSRPPAKANNFAGANRPLTTPVDAARFSRMITAKWRSRRRLASNSANTPNVSINTLPVTLPVSLGADSSSAVCRHSRYRGHFWLQ